MLPVSDVIPPRTTPFVTIGLIAANTLTFLYELQLDRHELFEMTRALGAVPAALTWPDLITSLFIHDGWIHFGVNVLYLWIFGQNVEDAAGHVGYLCFYLGAGAVAALAHAGLHPSSASPLVGATCAVASVMAAYLVQFPKSQVLSVIFFVGYFDVLEVPAIFLLGGWPLLQVLGDVHPMGAQTADLSMTLGAQAVGLALGLCAGWLLRWRGRKWD